MKTRVKTILSSNERYEKAKEALKNAKLCYADASLDFSLSKVRTGASFAIAFLLDAIMLFHGRYFHLGIKRTFEEMKDLSLPDVFYKNIELTVKSKSETEILTSLGCLIRIVEKEITVKQEKQQPSIDNLSGTYEEMFSNWRNKVEEAVNRNDTYASFTNLCSLQYMLHEMANEVEMEDLEIMADYDPEYLENNIKLYDHTLERYKKNYTKAGMEPTHYKNIQEFVNNYLA